MSGNRPELTPRQLADAVGCSWEHAALWLSHIHDAMEFFDISTPERAAMWLAQIGHESGGFWHVRESMNYSAPRLREVFPKYFPTNEIAEQYARQPEKIGSRVYGNRLGNGPEETGDGYRYRGRGLIQITGKANFQECGEALGLPLVEEPEKLSERRPAALSAGWFWSSRGCNELADQGDFRAVTRRINGGLNGLKDRESRWQKSQRALSIT